MKSIFEYIPEGSEIGVGLDLIQDNYHLYFLPGNRYNFSGDKIFYGGIGGHLEENESLIECARREAIEEIGVEIKLFSSDETYYLQKKNYKSIDKIDINTAIKPFVLYEMVNPQGAPKQGEIYYIIIYKAKLKEEEVIFKKDEVSSLLGLTED